MGLFSFFKERKSVTRERDDACREMASELARLRESVGGLEAKLNASGGTIDGFAADLRRLSLSQKEAGLQLEEIAELLSDPDDGVNPLLEPLMNICAETENFYRLASDDETAPLFEQARMMWDIVRRNLQNAEVRVIDGEGELLDFRLHAPARTEWDENFPPGHVLKTLVCGYMYQDKVIRRASVVVNKEEREEGV